MGASCMPYEKRGSGGGCARHYRDSGYMQCMWHAYMCIACFNGVEVCVCRCAAQSATVDVCYSWVVHSNCFTAEISVVSGSCLSMVGTQHVIARTVVFAITIVDRQPPAFLLVLADAWLHSHAIAAILQRAPHRIGA